MVSETSEISPILTLLVIPQDVTAVSRRETFTSYTAAPMFLHEHIPYSM
jgi:hypothetical protein